VFAATRLRIIVRGRDRGEPVQGTRKLTEGPLTASGPVPSTPDTHAPRRWRRHAAAFRPPATVPRSSRSVLWHAIGQAVSFDVHSLVTYRSAQVAPMQHVRSGQPRGAFGGRQRQRLERRSEVARNRAGGESARIVETQASATTGHPRTVACRGATCNHTASHPACAWREMRRRSARGAVRRRDLGGRRASVAASFDGWATMPRASRARVSIDERDPAL
jgi:hypothetical protein